MSSGYLPLSINVKSWFRDHYFAGKVVLPAVETMLLLAAKAVQLYPEVDIRNMENTRFAKFLEIPSAAETVSALVECDICGNGHVQAKLLSRIQFTSMSRISEHCEILFPLGAGKSNEQSILDFVPVPPVHSVIEVNAEQLYRELVPFGPNYQTLQETLYLSQHEAWGRLKAPNLPADPVQEMIGSPFPLDGALHAACVLGQQTVDFVPFPVGFVRRTIIRPTQPGSWYITRVVQVSATTSELVFDLAIWDNDGRLHEMVTGVQMRDVGKARRTQQN